MVTCHLGGLPATRHPPLITCPMGNMLQSCGIAQTQSGFTRSIARRSDRAATRAQMCSISHAFNRVHLWAGINFPGGQNANDATSKPATRHPLPATWADFPPCRLSEPRTMNEEPRTLGRQLHQCTSPGNPLSICRITAGPPPGASGGKSVATRRVMVSGGWRVTSWRSAVLLPRPQLKKRAFCSLNGVGQPKTERDISCLLQGRA